MKKILGNYTGQAGNDFPLDCETLEYIKNNTSLVEILGNLAGDKAILYGCDISSQGQMSAGYVFVRTTDYPTGEILYFEGGHASMPGHIVNEAVSVVAQSVTYEAAYFKRRLVSGYGDEEFPMSSFKKVQNLQQISSALTQEVDDRKNADNAINGKITSISTQISNINEKNTAQDKSISALGLNIVPVGTVLMWPSDTLPTNYMLCNGGNLSKTEYAALFGVLGSTYGADGSTFKLPDMRGRFVAGKGANDCNALNQKGGENKVKLTSAESGLPAHNHYTRMKSGDGGGGNGQKMYPHDSNAAYTDNNTAMDASQAHENRPPFIVLNYIIKVK